VWRSSTTASSICCTSAPSLGNNRICSVYVQVSMASRSRESCPSAQPQASLVWCKRSCKRPTSRRVETVSAQWAQCVAATPTGLPANSARSLPAPRRPTRSVYSLRGSSAVCSARVFHPGGDGDARKVGGGVGKREPLVRWIPPRNSLPGRSRSLGLVQMISGRGAALWEVGRAESG